jgi:hypothetical protein
MNRKWIRRVKEHIREIDNLDPEDRLELVSAISRCNYTIAGSVNGWAKWISDPSIMSKFTEENLRTILDEFKKVALPLLKNDIKWTEYLLEKMNISDDTDPTRHSRGVYIS